MGREVVNIRSSDIVIIMGGHSGTLGEFSIAYDEGNLIGVLLGTGGIASEIKNIVKIINKKTGAKVYVRIKSTCSLENLIEYYLKNHYKHPDIYSKNVVLLLSGKINKTFWNINRFNLTETLSPIRNFSKP